MTPVCVYCGEPLETRAVWPADARWSHGSCWRKANPTPPPSPLLAYPDKAVREPEDEDLL